MSEGFSNSVIAGEDTLARIAMQSLGFIAGLTGWRIERDGDAEFNSVTVRGLLVIRDANGQGFILDPTTGVIEVYSPNSLTGATITPGQIVPFLADAGPATIAFLKLVTATVNGMAPGGIEFSSESGDGTIGARATLIGDLYSQDNEDMGRGIVANWGAPADSAIFNAAEAAVMTSSALTLFDFPPNRAYELFVFGRAKMSTTAGNPLWRLRKTGLGGQVLVLCGRTPTNGINAEEAMRLGGIFTTDGNAATVTAQMSITGEGSAAYDSQMMAGSGGRYAFIRDIGPSSKFPMVNVLV